MEARSRNCCGFTLIELIIVIVVIGIMAAILTPIAVSSLRAYDNTLREVIILDKLRYATERLSREIREVNFDGTTGFAFGGMGAGSVNSLAFTRTFYDAAGNASTATVTIGNANSAVTLAYSTLATVAPQVLTDELSNLTLTFLDTSGNATSSAMLVRAVRISLTLTHNGQNYQQQTQVELKNIPS